MAELSVEHSLFGGSETHQHRHLYAENVLLLHGLHASGDTPSISGNQLRIPRLNYHALNATGSSTEKPIWSLLCTYTCAVKCIFMTNVTKIKAMKTQNSTK